MDGEDVKLLHRELCQLGYAIPSQEVEKGLFEKGTHEAVFMFQQTRNLQATGVVDEATAKAINDSFIVQGTVRQENQKPLPGAIVRAFDKDLRQEQLLGETSTNREGFYKIPYSRDQFRRAEKRNADLIVRAYHPNSPDLCLGESELIFNAKRVQEVDLPIDLTTLSEYEKYLAALDPVLEKVPVAELTKKDVAFLSGETGMPAQRIELLVTAARLGKQTELPPAAFYGFARMDLPTTLSDPLDQDTKILRKTLEAALERNIIPGALQKDLDRIIERLSELGKVDPGVRIKKQKGRLRRIGKIVDLDDTKMEAVVKKASSPAMLNDKVFASLVKAGELEEPEAKELGLTVSLYGLFDENLKLAEAVKKGKFPQIPRGKVKDIEDLVAFDHADWVALLKKTKTEPPGGITRENYAALFAKKVENLYPSKVMLARVTSRATDGLAQGLEDLNPLFEKNTIVVGAESFETLDVKGIDPKEVQKLRVSHTRLKGLANTYPGMAIDAILDDRKLSANDKEKQITARIGLLTRFHSQNPDKEFLFFDYSPDSVDIQAMDFAGFSADEQCMVLKTLKACQRMYSVTQDGDHAKLFLEMGHHSPFSITRNSRQQFVASTDLSTTVAEAYYDGSRSSTTGAILGVTGALDLVSGAHGDLAVDNTDPAITDYLKKIDGWEALFGSLDYCKCEHCRSILSPAAYFVDMMRFIKMHILDEFFEDRENHVLHLNSRRPDLWKLPLTCENTHDLIPYLDIINEVLENYIAIDLDLVDENDDHLKPGAEDRSELENGVYEKLLDSANSFCQPFSLPLERLAVYLAHFDVTRGDITKLLDEPPDVVAAAALKLSKLTDEESSSGLKREYELITEANTDLEHLISLYGLTFQSESESRELVFHDPALEPEDERYEESKNDVQLLLKAMGVTRAEIGQLITTQFVCTAYGMVIHGGAESVEIHSEKRVSEGDDASAQNDIERIHGLSEIALDRMHRFTRLWRHVPWSIKELDLVLHKLRLAGLGSGIEEVTLQHLTTTLMVQQRFGLSIEEMCALWSYLPEDSVTEGKESLFDRLFNLPDFVRLDETFPKDDEAFLHPAFRNAPPPEPEVDYTLHRLLAGLRVDDETLHLLISNLIRPLRGLEPDSPEPVIKEFLLSKKNLSLLFRHARLSKQLRISIPHLFQLIRLAPAIPSDHIGGLRDLSALLEFYDWWKSANYTLDDLAVMTGRPVQESSAYPDAASIATKMLQKVQVEQALTFTHNVFAFMEGVTEEQSQAIIVDEGNTGVFAEARGTRYRCSETVDPDLDIVIPADIGDVPATSEEVRAVLLTYATESKPVFDDTLFTMIEGVSEEQSRAIVAANPEWIVAAPIENAYWLEPSFPGASLVIPDGIPVTEAATKALLSTYHTKEIIPNYLAGELGIPAEKIKASINLAGIDLADPIFTEALKGEALAESILNLVNTLLPLTILFKDKAFDRGALDFVREHLHFFGHLDITSVGMENVRMVSIFLDFLRKLDERELERQGFYGLLESFDPDAEIRKFYTRDTVAKQEIQLKLAQALDAELGLAITAHDELSLAGTALDALAKLKRCLDLAKRLGVGGDVLKLIVSNDYEKLNKAANAILSAFRAKYDDEEQWQEKIDPFEDKIRSRKRDALTDYLIHSLDPKIFSNLNDLYHHFLIDVELEGCARTSRVVAANSSVQLYVHRVLMNLEQDRAGKIHLSMDEDAIEEWEWRKNYRVWEANRKIFLYPENYIEPDLRDNKTPLFKELESTLLQQEINEDTVLDAYASYMRGFDEVANLKIAGSYHDIGDETDFLHLFGVTASDPPTYYYRAVENAYWGEKDPEKCGIIWHPWRKIDVQIPVKKVSPIVFNGKLYVFWVEITTRPENEVIEGSSNFVGYKHTMSLKITTLRLDGTWTPPQRINLYTPPFDGEGIINDLLLNEQVLVQVLSEDDTFPITKPKYGEIIDEHTGNETTSYVSEELERLNNEKHDSEGRFLTIEEQQKLVQKLSKFESKDGYSLCGFQWEQVYPHPRYYENAIILTGRDFQMRSKIDLYRLAIGRRDLYDGAEIYGKILSWNVENKVLYWGLAPSSLRSWLDPYAYASILIDQRRIEYYGSRDFVEWDSEAIELLHRNLYRFPVARNLNSSAEISAINGSFNDGLIDFEGDLLYIQARPANFGENPLDYLVKRLGTTLAGDVSSRLFAVGVERLLSLDSQMELKEWDLPINIESDCFTEDRSNAGIIDWTGPYGVYYREIFFHIPFLIANHLNSQQKFAEAQEWYHYIFNPTAKANDTESPKDRVWRYLEFRKNDVESLREQLTDTDSIETYKNDPFNPHAIARLPLRFSAYQKSIVMKYIDNLLDWGDHLFAQDTMESINEATLLYVLASDILGERPAELGECGEVGPKTYKEIAPLLNEENEFLIEMWHVVQRKTSQSAVMTYHYAVDPSLLHLATTNAHNHITMCAYTASSNIAIRAGAESAAESAPRDLAADWVGATGVAERSLAVKNIFRGLDWSGEQNRANNIKRVSSFFENLVLEIGPVFCIPENKNLKSYWDRVVDRLYKIRNCMNISGIRRELSLFAPEIDPMLLVRAKAAGLSIEDILNSISGNLPPYRFSYLIERAKGYAAMLQGFGAALLSALEKKDIEQLNLDRTVHQQNILRMTRQVRQWEIDAAVEACEALQKRKEAIEYRKGYYDDLLDTGLIPSEVAQSVSRVSAQVYETLAAVQKLVSSITFLIPRVGSPFAMTYGGKELGDCSNAASEVFRSTAAIHNSIAASAGLEAGFQRRKEGWQHQETLADHELNELQKQIKAAEIRLEIANKSMEIHDKASEQLDEVYEFYQDKFTNLGLYTWLSTNLQRLFREAYNNAYAVAKLAEQAYRFERGDDSSELIGPNHWEASKTGLLAGERLLMDLQNLERKFLETNYRSLEIDQAFSLTQINPAALIQLKETGSCQFEIPEIFFNLFYPGHYRRRIKAARLTIPCITGPYTNVSATLSLLSSQLRNEPKLDDPGTTYLLDVPRSRSITIATSTAQNDAGVFELNFRDERYMPFEGAGAVSKWQLSLPKNFRQFDYQTINDVMLHISYTAEDDGTLREEVEALNGELEDTIQYFLREESLPRVFSLRQEFSNEFNRLLHSPAGDPVQIQITDKHFPIFLKGQNLNIKTAQLVLRTPEEQSMEGFDISINDEAQTGFDPDTTMGDLPANNLNPGAVFSEGILGEHTLVVNNAGDLAPAPDSLVPPDVSAIDSEKLTDIYLYLEYGIS
jgi:hypothetical protein